MTAAFFTLHIFLSKSIFFFFLYCYVSPSPSCTSNLYFRFLCLRFGENCYPVILISIAASSRCSRNINWLWFIPRELMKKNTNFFQSTFLSFNKKPQLVEKVSATWINRKSEDHLLPSPCLTWEQCHDFNFRDLTFTRVIACVVVDLCSFRLLAGNSFDLHSIEKSWWALHSFYSTRKILADLIFKVVWRHENQAAENAWFSSRNPV